jgi:ssDNA-binding Zn-finger/Zn-ribbon topoisomerase 1
MPYGTFLKIFDSARENYLTSFCVKCHDMSTQIHSRKRPHCAACGALMMRLYIHTQDENKKRHYDGVGWMCSNPVCRYMMQDEM